MTNKKAKILRTMLAYRGLSYILLFVLEQSGAICLHAVSGIEERAAVYALVAVSMNLLNGFTGLFSLGQAGFMLLGAYTYGIITIPEASRESVYRMFSGEHWVKFSLADIFGTTGAGSVVGMLIALILGGLVAALFACLIGLPVLRLKSDYLAIATLGFAEIIRAIFQWDKLGPLTNGANVLGRVPVLQLHRGLLSGGRRMHRPDRTADQLHLRPCLQGHPR